MTRIFFRILIASLAFTAITAFAAEFPARPVRLIVPFPPGGPLDIVGRLVARKLQDQWGQSVVVDNRGGASGAIGTGELARSAPDGHTLLVNSTPIVATPHLQKLPYDTLRDLVGVSQIAAIDYVLVATPRSGIGSVEELIAAAKKQPGKLNYASAGIGSGQHLFVELMKGATGANLNHVPYKGAAAAVQAVLAGEVDLMFEVSVGVLAQIKAGKLRALLVTGAKPVEALPGVPPFESLFPGVGIEAWHGMFAPAATPAAVVQQIAADVGRAVMAPEISSRLRELGFQPTGLPHPRFQEVVARDLERWGQVIRDNNIRAD
jgi:tripartite-type tricarboxylate transporter receptor subunit TctC